MATGADVEASASSDGAILSRLVFPEDDELMVEAARSLLQIRLGQGDLDRAHELALKNQDDRLTAAERTELENDRRVGFLVDLMHVKARLVLNQRSVH